MVTLYGGLKVLKFSLIFKSLKNQSLSVQFSVESASHLMIDTTFQLYKTTRVCSSNTPEFCLEDT